MNLKIGKKIAALRKMQQITQTQLAEYLAVNPQTVSRWEADGGMPDITLLPKIALFFGVSIDDLFGMTDMEQIKNLVYKYSVLRDDKSFEAAMQNINLAVGSIEEQLKDSADTEHTELNCQRQQLLALKVHLYIQKSRKAENDAETLLDTLLSEITSDNNLYLSLKLQKQQFLIHNGEGAYTLENARNAWANEITIDNLHCYMAALSEMGRGKDILQLWEHEDVQKIVSTITAETIPLWQIMFCGAVMDKDLSFFEKYFCEFRKHVDKYAIFRAKMNLAELYKTLEMDVQKEDCKARLIEMLDTLAFNEYIKSNYLQKIQTL